MSVLVAVCLGVTFSILANTSKLHDALPDWVTKRTSFPSEWHSAFSRDKCYVYLHLTKGRRLYGWPTEWPDQPDKGHFVIQEPEWILDDNQRAPLLLTEKMLIPVSDVEMVEFEKPKHTWNHDPAQHEASEELLVGVNLDKAKPVDGGPENNGRPKRRGRRSVHSPK